MARARKYGPAFGKTAKSAIKKMISEGSVVAVKPARRPRKAKVSTNVKKYVKKALDMDKEDHIVEPDALANQDSINANGFDSQQIVATVSGTNYYRGLTTANLVPDVSQGDTVSSRSGNAIKPKYLEVSYLINSNPLQKGKLSNTNDWYNNIGRPFWVRIVIYRRKDNQFLADNSKILDNGASSTNFIDISDIKLPYNKDLYQILHTKNIKMSPSRAETYTQGTNTLTDAITYVNSNNTVANYLGKVRLKLPSKLLFSDASPTPTNYACFLAAGCIMMDGQSFKETPSTNRPEFGADITVKTRLVFEDM